MMKLRKYFWAWLSLLAFATQSLAQQAAPVPTVAPTIVPTPVPVPTATPVPKLEPRPFAWAPLAFDLPASIQVFTGYAVNADGQPVRAWYANVDYSDRNVQAKALISTSERGREPTSSLGAKIGALVTINGGYFTMKGPAATLNTVISDGKVLAENPATVTRGEQKIPLLRGVFGVRAERTPAERTFDVKWVAHLDGQVFAYPAPLPGAPDNPPPSPAFPAGGAVWDVQEAIGGGPVLMTNGVIDITGAQEQFGASHVSARHPRTAIGAYVRDGRPHLVLFVVDGRQPLHSMGMSLPELAQTMKDIGCSEALNLDGGGSTAFVVRNAVLNKPSDGRERNVTSALALVERPQ